MKTQTISIREKSNIQKVKMKAIILNGSQENDMTGERIGNALMTELQTSGWNVEHVVIRDQKIGNCAGDFFCWVRSPGICHIDDDNRRISKAIMSSDLVVYLSPITFGGYSSILKRMVDHQIQNISPYFVKIYGETHHKKRYNRYPDLLAIGWMDTPDSQVEAVFSRMVMRNALNLYAEKAVCGVVPIGETDDQILALVRIWLNKLHSGTPLQAEKLPESNNATCSAREIRRALLLVGSPRTTESTSNSLGRYLFEKLSSHSIQTETVYLHTMVRSPEKMKALFAAIDTADLVMLAFPLYVDSLPAPVIDALEQIAAYRQSRKQIRRPLFTAISNCGFPEANHNTTALAICEIFAKQAQFEWAGSLALSGGIIAGKPLVEAGGRTIRIRKALDLAAEALSQGQPIPKAAQNLISKLIIPAWVYRLTGDLGWKRAAKQYRASKLLKRQPYLVEA